MAFNGAPLLVSTTTAAALMMSASEHGSRTASDPGIDGGDPNAVQEAFFFGLRSMEQFILQIAAAGTGHLPPSKSQQEIIGEIAEISVSEFRKAVSILDRTGHARFRRSSQPLGKPTGCPLFRASAPSPKDRFPAKAPLNVDFLMTEAAGSTDSARDTMDSAKPAMRRNTSFVSSVTADGCFSSSNFPSVSSGETPQKNSAPPGFSAAKPPLCRGRNKASRNAVAPTRHPLSASGRCHCATKKMSRTRHIVRVPAISSNAANIPPDDYAWRKYGQKPIKGSPYPRNYYRCSTVRVCPARKHVERASDDPSMLIITYENVHRHAAAVAPIH